MFLKSILPVLLIAGFFYTTANAQTETQKWRALTSSPQLLWVDAAQLDTIRADVFEIWVVELHKPALILEGITAKVNRTKTLYLVNRNTNTYGIKKVVYYNNANKEIWQYDYNLDKMAADMRCGFPIMQSSFFYKIFETVDKKKTVTANE